MSALTSLEHTGNTDHKIGQELQNVDADLLKGRLDDLEGGGGAGPEDHAGDVEAHLGEAARRRPVAEPPGGQAPEPALLLPRHRLGGDTEARARPRLDLAEDDAALPGDDEVELTLPAAPVPAEHPVAPARVPVGGDVLASGAEIEPPPIHRRPAARREPSHQTSLP